MIMILTLEARGLHRLGELLLYLFLLWPAPQAGAQDSGGVGVLGGITQYDLNGTGSTPVVSLRAASALNRSFVFEAALSYLAYASQGEDRVWHFLPEAQVQWQWARTGVKPYVGGGLGASHARSVDASRTELTTSVAAGVRVPFAGAWMLQTELRVRSVDPWAGTTADWGLGILGLF